jgi:hypothetical protein
MKFVVALWRFATACRDVSAALPTGKTQGKAAPPMRAIRRQTLVATEHPFFSFEPTNRAEDGNDEIFARGQMRARW